MSPTITTQPVAPPSAQSFLSQFATPSEAIAAIQSQAQLSALASFRAMAAPLGAVTVADWVSLASLQSSIPHTGDGQTPSSLFVQIHNAIQAAVQNEDTSTLWADLWLYYIATRPR